MTANVKMAGEEKIAVSNLQLVKHLNASMVVPAFHGVVENVAIMINTLIVPAPMATMGINVKPLQRFPCMEIHI